jgi:hypothetical protein
MCRPYAERSFSKFRVFSRILKIKKITIHRRERREKTGKLEYWNIDGIVKSRNSIKFVIPAKAGIQLFQDVLDPGFRRGDPSSDFLRDHQYWYI